MLNTFKNIFQKNKPVNFSLLLKSGAQIVDVRTPAEFVTGHIKGSINIPLQNLSTGFKKLKKDKPIITCCASGMRSATAKSLFEESGFKEVHNGGGWEVLNSKL